MNQTWRSRPEEEQYLFQNRTDTQHVMINTRSCILLLFLTIIVHEVNSIITIDEWKEAFELHQVRDNIETYLSERPAAAEGGETFFFVS